MSRVEQLPSASPEQEEKWEQQRVESRELMNRNKALETALTLAGLKENGGKAVFPVLWDAEKIYRFLQGETYDEIAPKD